jgi:hypothetical protein
MGLLAIVMSFQPPSHIHHNGTHHERRILMGRPRSPGVEDIRYINPITGVTSSTSQYIDEQGIKKPVSKKEYKIYGEWVKINDVPHNREVIKKHLSSKKGFMQKILKGMNQKVRQNERQGKSLHGENEFKDDRYGRCDKLMEAFDKQVERYGDRCPITLIPFTMKISYEKFDINNYSTGIFSNVSPDRIFNHIGYTEQNLIFTSQLWNFKKGGSSLYELELIFQPEIMERYKEIVMERFPDQKYVL